MLSFEESSLLRSVDDGELEVGVFCSKSLVLSADTIILLIMFVVVADVLVLVLVLVLMCRVLCNMSC